MRIVLAYNYDPSNLRNGGGITYVHNLLNYLLNNHFQVVLFGVSLKKKSTFTHPNLKFIPVLHNSDNWWKFLYKLPTKIKEMKFEKTDVIHTHHPLVMRPFIKYCPENYKLSTFHGIPLDWVKINYPYLHSILCFPYKFLEKRIIENIDKIVAPSEYTQKRLLSRYPYLVNSNKIAIIPSGVDLELFKPLNSKNLKEKHGIEKYNPLIIYVGRLARIKNIPFLLESFKYIEGKYPKAALLIVGRGEVEKEIKKIANNLELHNVIFKGEVNKKEVVELINCSDVLVLTSYFESSPTVVKEAISCGVPVVSTDVGDVKSFITKDSVGQVLNDHDPQKFSEAIIKIISLKKNESEIVKNECRKVASELFSFQNIGKSYISLYKHQLKK